MTEPTPQPDLAARMYPSQAPAAAAPAVAIMEPGAAPVRSARARQEGSQGGSPAIAGGREEAAPDPGDAGKAPPSETPISVEELIDRDITRSEAMYGDGAATAESPAEFEARLGEVFDDLETDARWHQNQEDAQALAEGRRESAALMHELAIPRHEAGEIARTLRQWHGRPPVTEDQRWEAKERTLEALQKEWGRETAARIALAQRTANEASKRLPWLGELLRSGAGNDPALIKRLADIGLRQARKARR